MHAPSRRDWARFDPTAIPTKTHTPQLERWLDALRPPLRCLDIGCGAGSGVRQLLARGCSVVGIDINPAAVAQLTAALQGAAVELHVRDVASEHGLGLEPECCDAALCQLVASVVGDAADRAALLRNMHAALRPGAPCFVSFSGLSDDLNASYAELYARDAAATQEHGSYLSRAADGCVLYRTHHFSRAEIEWLLGAHGFANIEVEESIESSSRRPDQRARFYYVSCTRS